MSRVSTVGDQTDCSMRTFGQRSELWNAVIKSHVANKPYVIPLSYRNIVKHPPLRQNRLSSLAYAESLAIVHWVGLGIVAVDE